MEVDAISEKLGLEGPVSQDLEGLRRVFAAWCSAVPFDNLLKTRALFNDPNGQLPALDPEEFFRHWLASGTGGTCWPHANAMYSYVAALGFDARRAVGSMFDFGHPNHGTVIVALPDESHWLLDNVFLNGEPLCLDAENPSLVDGPVHFAEVEHAEGTVFIHGTMPPFPAIFFRLLDWNVSESAFAEGYEVSRGRSAFNDRAHAMRCHRDRIDVVRGHFHYLWNETGLSKEVLDETALHSCLITTIGVSGDFVDDWASSGALAGSMNTEEGSLEGVPRRSAPSRKVPEGGTPAPPVP